MTGGLLNIVSYGSNDLYLTGAPQITFFKIVYRRHTNFSIESMEIGLNTTMNFNQQYEILVDRYGDLIGNTYLKIKLPETYFSRKQFGIPDSIIDYTKLNTATNNFNTVKNFMIYNIQAYRDVYEESLVVDPSLENMLNSVQYDFSGNDAQTAYNNYITLYNTELTTENYIIAGYLYTSNIYSLYLNEVNNTNINAKQFYEFVNFAYIYSQKVYDYYWNILNIEQQNINIQLKQNLKFAWDTHLAHSMINYVDVTLGGELADRNTGNYFEVNYQLTKQFYMQPIYDVMIGNITDLTTYDGNPKKEYIITLPLQFWFNKNIGSAFPLIATQYTDMGIRINLKNINNCGYIESVNGITYSLEDLWNDKNYRLEISLLVDYIFLDEPERKKFAQSSHEYLIENIQIQEEFLSNTNLPAITTEINNITPTTNFNVRMDFKHPTKNLLWTFQKKIFLDDKNGLYKCIYDNYALDIDLNKDPLINANLLINSYTRYEKNVGTAGYHNLINPYEHKQTIPDKCGIYEYSIALYPEDLQPSSTCNFSRFLGQVLCLTIDNRMFYYVESDINPGIINNKDNNYIYTDIVLNILCKAYTVLRISGGFAALAFTFNT